MPVCLVPGCLSYDNPRRTFFSLPRNRRLRQRWLLACGRRDIEIGFLCSLHFEDNDFVESSNQEELKPDAVPSKRIWRPSVRLPRSEERRYNQEIRRYLLDTERRLSVRADGFDTYIDRFLRVMLYAGGGRNSSLISMGGGGQNTSTRERGVFRYMSSTSKGQLRELSRMSGKLARRIARLENCCRYWYSVAANRGKILSKLKAENRKLKQRRRLSRRNSENSS